MRPSRSASSRLMDRDGGSHEDLRAHGSRNGRAGGPRARRRSMRRASRTTPSSFSPATTAASVSPIPGRSPARRRSCWKAACGFRRWFAGPGHIPAGRTTRSSRHQHGLDAHASRRRPARSPIPAYPPDGMNLLPQLTQNAPPVPRKLFWRYHYNAQRAHARRRHEVSPNRGERVSVQRGRRSAGTRQSEETAARCLPPSGRRLRSWNATMLPDSPDISSGPLGFSDELADHFGVQRK